MGQLRKTSVDYVVIAIIPALIMGMIAALVFYLLSVTYTGPHLTRLLFIFSMFIMATVLIARLSIEQGRAYAFTYAMPLAGASLLAMGQLVEIRSGMAGVNWLFHLVLLGVIWWAADRLTFDCTVIDRGDAADDDEVDEPEDPTGEGLLQSLGWDDSVIEGQSARESIRLTKADSSSEEKDERKSRPHNPGVWVIRFAIVALPLFALGQLMAGSAAVSSGRLFVYLALFAASALGLLLTTSLLGLRRYLRYRRVEMPLDLVGVWLGWGMALIIALLIICAVLPRPTPDAPWTQLPVEVRSPVGLRTSEHAVDADDAQQTDAAASGAGSESDSRPGGSSGDSQQNGNTGRQSSSGQSSSGQSSSGQSSSGQSSSGQSSSGQSSSGQSSSGQSSSGQSSSGQSSSGQSSSGQSSSGQSSSGQSSSGQSSSGQSSSGQSSSGQSSSGQSSSGQSSSGQSSSGQSSSGQSSSGQSSSGQSSSGQSSSGQGNSGQGGGNSNGGRGGGGRGDGESTTENSPEASDSTGNGGGGGRTRGQRSGRSSQGRGNSRSEDPERSDGRADRPENRDGASRISVRTAESDPENSSSGADNNSRSAEEGNAGGRRAAQTRRLPRVSLTNGVMGLVDFVIRLVVIGGLVAALLYFGWRNRRELSLAMQRWWEQFQALLQRLLGRQAPVESEPTRTVVPPPLGPRFSEFENPFADGSANRLGVRQLVIYSFEALEAWAQERGCARPADQTADEFAQQIAARQATIGHEAQRLAFWYARAVYASTEVPKSALSDLSRLWQRMVG